MDQEHQPPGPAAQPGEAPTALGPATVDETLQPSPVPPPPGEASGPGSLQRVAGRDPWDSLPAAGLVSGASGRQVLRVLTLPAWKHYRDLRFVAEGGMGRVFKAYDPTLQRPVALKFLRRDEPDLVARFALEAQHQARIDHPNICRVYEVGEWQEQSYIAMQYLDGTTLDGARLTLSLEERVRVLETVAEAIHAAHRAGLIHRDLKPPNIMVRWEEGRPVPAILDFGLARGPEQPQLTQQGLAVGTPHYMAPEQARGDHAHIDRRTDVYGLGATLHKVLTGEAPFGAYEGMEALRRTVEADVPSLRRIVSDLPEDLDTITRKCLEKDPARRYPSAQALAEDLRRWREGEPIQARRPSAAYLARTWARRHKLVVLVGAMALATSLAFAGLALATAASARTRARHAQHFGQEAERIEALLRYAHLLPPHDVRPELVQARARMAALEAEAQRAGDLAAGPAAYALGRAHLALGEVEPALRLLEQAWAGGLRSPEVSLALGRAQAGAYQRALDLARALPSKDLREARERDLARDLRDPALAHLKAGAPAALETPAYHEALMAFIEGRWDQAQVQARAALVATPWLFEAKRLEGEALLAQARAAQDPSLALPLLDQAEAAFDAAGRLGPSDPTTALGRVRTLSEQTALELSSGRNGMASLARCREAVDRARALRPDQGLAPALLARALARWAELRPIQDPGTTDAFREISRLIEEARSLSPDDPAVMGIRAPILLVLGARQAREQGQNPMPFFQEAQDLAREARRRHPQEPLFTALLANACMRRMTWEMNTGTAPWPSFEEGLAQALALRAQFPDYAGAYQGLSTLWIERAEYERCHGLDPSPAVAAALEAATAAEARGLRLRNPGWAEGDAHLIRGQYLLATQGGGEADFQQAAEGYRQALRANPNLLEAHNALAEAALGRAQAALERGDDPGPALAEAEAHLASLGPASPARGQSEHLRGLAALLRGRRRLALGGDPGPDWARATAAFHRAGATSGLAKGHAGEAEAFARAYRHRGLEADRTRALGAARRALERDPKRAEAWLWIAAAEQEALRRGRRESEGPAREAWTRALALDANLRRTALSLGMP